MQQFELGGAGDGLVSSPLQGAAIGARSEEAVQDREKDRAFGSKAKAAPGEGVVHGLAAAGEGPQRFKHECGTQHTGLGTVGVGLEGVLAGGQDSDLLGETAAGGEQAVEGTTGLEEVQPAERGEDPLADRGALADGLDKLNVDAIAAGFGAQEHGLSPDTTKDDQNRL